jgi:phytoene dehydrogenase-like protein
MNADYLIVGSGINGLVAAALLGRRRQKVKVLERNPRIGGCLLTRPSPRPAFCTTSWQRRLYCL